MKTILGILLLITFSQSFAEEKKVDSLQDVHKKYCEQKVASACDALKPQATPVQFQFNKDQVANVQKLLNSVEKQCGSSNDCKIKEVEKIANNVIQEMKQKCTQGDKDACYQNEIYELEGQGKKSSP